MTDLRLAWSVMRESRREPDPQYLAGRPAHTLPRVLGPLALYSPVTALQPLPGLNRIICRATTPVVGPRSFS